MVVLHAACLPSTRHQLVIIPPTCPASIEVHFFGCLLPESGHSLCPVTAKLSIFSGATGGNGTITCSFTEHDDKKFFCKDDCKGENILVETDGGIAANGRYSISYTEVSKAGSSSELSKLAVTIRNLTKSDSARYRCGIGETNAPRKYSDFEVRVVDDPVHGNTWFARTHIEGENFTRGCSDPVPGGWKFLCRDNCSKTEDVLLETNNAAQSSRFSLEYKENSVYGLYVTISNLTRSDTGWYRCGYGRALSSASFNTFPLIVIPDPSSTWSPEEASSGDEQHSNFPTDAMLYVVVVLAVIIIILGLALTLVCVQKNITPHDLNSRGCRDDVNMEVWSNEYQPPAPGCEVTIYENLDLAKKDQTYYNLG
ncbi:polymeric immunoglobulin receptor-like [Cheilinus undulatus]|uniref:polymeric immunoglobulin receptor-like n=1 Tax=Cheilinus undulatus TaxID=241271 RepID=UPI001BD44F96|nr:polymeric immunoglobulin receptor-like [Cheilinus undulatus]